MPGLTRLLRMEARPPVVELATPRAPVGAGGPAAPPSMQQQLDQVREMCRTLSMQHRLALPPEMVRDRLHGLAQQAGELFADRMMEIGFLLDQYGTLRYNELRRLLGVISTRTLAGKLAFLHREGFVIRTMFDENPPRVEYRLSPRGKALTDLLFPAMLHVGQGGTA